MSDWRDVPNPQNVPTFGFVRHLSRAKRPCVTCNRRVYVGIVNIHDPDGKMMCTRCYDALDDSPTSFEDAEL